MKTRFIRFVLVVILTMCVSSGVVLAGPLNGFS